MKKRNFGWRALVIAGLVALLLLVLDPFVTRVPAGGLCPADASWLVFSSDFPSFYADLLKSDFAAAMSDEAPDYQAAWQLSVRKTVGIRPTPLRWRMWLGDSFLWSTSPEGSGACVRPGILLRVADTLAGIGGDRPRVRQFGPYYYGWRDGYVVFSQAEQYVRASLDTQFFRPRPQHDGQLWIYESRESRTALGVTAGPHLSVSGWLEGTGLHSRPQGLSLGAWPPKDALAWAVSTHLADLAAIEKSVQAVVLRNSDIASSGWYQTVAHLLSDGADKWGAAAMPPDWAAQTVESALVLFDVDDSETFPVPEVGLVLRQQRRAEGAHPLEPLAAGGPVMPYEWQGHQGKLIPLAGEKATLCLSSAGNDWLAASQEPVMARLLDVLKDVAPAETGAASDVTLGVNWSKVSERGISLARKWAGSGAMAGLDEQRVEKGLAPLARVVGRLGVGRLDWRERDGRLQFEGVITSGAEQ